MTPERYHQIDKLFQAALERAPAERSAFLDPACMGDRALRKEVESLITSYDEGLSFIDEPAFEVVGDLLVNDEPELVPGVQIDRYEIVSLIGSGGMGEVYLAHDKRLDRPIALKLLPSDFTLNEQRLRRFQQEARAASALNHPNIITIHEIGHVEDRHFIAMEFVEGETLRARLKRSPLSLSEALDIAIQICGALAAAHRAGIIHRDIKPENIMLRSDGYVKVLDFGVAKLIEQLAPGAPSHIAEKVDVSSGLVMGTVKYMSPEQARGQEVDPRSDIFSFGVVLYEMLAGRSPFEGETARELVAAILKQEPPPLTQVPDEMRLLISKALHKRKEERYQTIQDLLVNLKSSREDNAIGAGSAVPRQELSGSALSTSGAAAISTVSTQSLLSNIRRHRTLTAVVVAALFISLAAIAFLTYTFVRQPKATAYPQNITLTRVTTSDKAWGAAISPDGKSVAYVASDAGQQSLWIRELTGNRSIQIAPGTAIDGELTFSPDSASLYYFGKSKEDSKTWLYQVPTAGGVPKKLFVKGNINLHITFSPDGKRLAFVTDNTDNDSESAVWVANTDGTDQRNLATRKLPAYFWTVAWSPDGKRIACAGGNKKGDRSYADLVEIAIEDGTEKPMTSQNWSGINDIAWLSDGIGLLMTASDRADSPLQIWLLQPDSNPRRITTDLNDYTGLSLTADSNALVTTQNSRPMNIWMQPDGEPERAIQITSGVTTRDGLSGISWTPDGRIVYSSSASGRPDIWIMDADGSNRKQLTVDLGSDRFGLSVTRDGRYILFSSLRAGNGNANIWRVDFDGSNPTQLTGGNGVEINPFCSPDSKWVYYVNAGSQIRWKVSIDGGDPVQMSGPYSKMLGFSPDGSLIAYLAPDDQGKNNKVGIASSEGGVPITVLDQVENAPRMQWMPDGSALTYFGGREASNVWSLPISGGPRKQSTDFNTDLNIQCFAWSRDGKRLAVARGAPIKNVVLIKDFR